MALKAAARTDCHYDSIHLRPVMARTVALRLRLWNLMVLSSCATARFTGSIAADLRSLVIGQLGGLTGSGIETGGILIGHPKDGELHICGFEEASCEHRSGPSYVLSEVD